MSSTYYEWQNEVLGMLQDLGQDTYDPDKLKELYAEGYEPYEALDELYEPPPE